jgi:hypothetical protein
MTPPSLDIEGIEIVLIGSFNPKIVQPAWLATEGLVPKGEADAAKLHIVHPELTSFSLGWVSVQVTTDRFVATTDRTDCYEPCRDLVLGIFQLLRHTPVSRMGINRNMHYRMATEEEWHAVGHKLAPKEPWQGILSQPGMKSLLMQGQRPDAHNGFVFVRVEPSSKVRPGVYVQVNDHFDRSLDDDTAGCSEMMNILSTCWTASVTRALQVGRSIVGLDAGGTQV